MLARHAFRGVLLHEADGLVDTAEVPGALNALERTIEYMPWFFRMGLAIYGGVVTILCIATMISLPDALPRERRGRFFRIARRLPAAGLFFKLGRSVMLLSARREGLLRDE
jgi:hypothetical protein